jgi:hypothetical protein
MRLNLAGVDLNIKTEENLKWRYHWITEIEH